MNQGITTIGAYKEAIKGRVFNKMEAFSADFLKENGSILATHRKKWVHDPLHQWSRQYEYPFVYEAVKDVADAGKGREISILDAGSGVTFFPFFISSLHPKAVIHCCDSDISVRDEIGQINRSLNGSITCFQEDLRKMSFENACYDIVYCISVLEHTDDYDGVVTEVKRILKEDGIFIVTFDISLDGKDDISVQRAGELIEILDSHFSITEDFNPVEALEKVSSNDILTTGYIREYDKRLLPWRLSKSKAVKDILRLRRPRTIFRDLTFFCAIFKK